MTRLSDYVFQRLTEWGVEHVFVLTGGGAMFLNDSLARSGITPICNHHEQASAMAAEAYARIAGVPGVLSVTSGPGGINALNGVFGAWTDSIPMLVLSGQVKRETCMAVRGIIDLRQLGDQEVDIIRMVSGITKYAHLVAEPASIRYHLEKAWSLCRSGRPGPCWLDIPVDVQASQVDETSLEGYSGAADEPGPDATQLKQWCRTVIDRIRSSRRPVTLAGSGVRISGAVDLFRRVARKLRIPVITAWTHDLIASDDPLFCGRAGSIGERAGNFTVQNADALLILGSRLNIRQVSYNWQSFARGAYKMQVDIDAAELHKPTVRPDLPIHCDVVAFLEEMDRQLETEPLGVNFDEWTGWCKQRLHRYPATAGKQPAEDRLNPYLFLDQLFQQLDEDDIVVCGNATACVVPFQIARLKANQRLISNSGAASMGYDLPAAIGSAIAGKGKRVICLAGDGSIQLNLQELQTVVQHNLPIKIFVLSNGGYRSIRTTQETFFSTRIGESAESGLSFPDMVKVAQAFGLAALRIDPRNCAEGIRTALSADGPWLSEVMLDPSQKFEPRLSSRALPDGRMVSSPLEDMCPFLERDEFLENLLIPAWDPQA